MAGDEATQALRELMPLAATLGIRTERYTADEVVLSLDSSLLKHELREKVAAAAKR